MILVLLTGFSSTLPFQIVSAPAELSVSWNALLRYLTAIIGQGVRFSLILDELPYLIDQSPELLPFFRDGGIEKARKAMFS